MPLDSHSRLAALIAGADTQLLNDWIRLQTAALMRRSSVLTDRQLRDDSSEVLGALQDALRAGAPVDLSDPAWGRMRQKLDDIARSRGQLGFSPSETATFVFSLKEPLFALIGKEFGSDAAALADHTWAASALLDKLGLYTFGVYQQGREQVILRQQQEMMELSTPVVKIWDNILALPLIGTLDSARTQVVMQNLLEAIVADSAAIAIIDITGVPTVDTLVAQHLLKTVAAARLMGADCIISGIRPQIAQTIIHLGVDLAGVTTKATLADAIKLSLRRLNFSIVANTKSQGA
jgi:rsbT co-antagonist protein RsbR